MRPTLLIGSVALVAFVLAVLASLPDKPPPSAGGKMSIFPRARGALHVHSRYSDGTGDFRAIARAARRAGLDFFVITDHRDMVARESEGDAYEEGVLRLIGVEVSTDGGHLLGLDIPVPRFRFGSDPQEVLRDVVELGGFAIVAHPFAERRDFTWTSWDVTGYQGMEHLNLYSAGARLSAWQTLVMAATYPFSPQRALASGLGWSPGALDSWDRLLESRRLAGWAGLDAHGRIARIGSFEIPGAGYEVTFRLVRNHLLLHEPLTGEVEHDRREVYRALREGRGYVALDGLADGSRFAFYAERGDERWQMGELVPWDGLHPEPLRFVAQVEGPPETELVVLRDGQPAARSSSGTVSLDGAGSGVYRAEARLASRYAPGKAEAPWIVSNPIFVLPQGEMTRRELVSFPPHASAGDLVCEPASFEFHAEHDSRSWMDPSAARSAGGAFRLVFRLASPEEGHPYVWCSVGERAARDLSRYQAVRFQVRADDLYRVDLQLRDQNPRASDEGTEWWAASFKTARTWSERVVPLDSLKSISPAGDGRLDLDRYRGLFFVLDSGNTRPGVGGWIEVRGLELCRHP